jgi:hypothetical protein
MIRFIFSPPPQSGLRKARADTRSDIGRACGDRLMLLVAAAEGDSFDRHIALCKKACASTNSDWDKGKSRRRNGERENARREDRCGRRPKTHAGRHDL